MTYLSPEVRHRAMSRGILHPKGPGPHPDGIRAVAGERPLTHGEGGASTIRELTMGRHSTGGAGRITLMRVERSLLTGAAVAAVLALGAPAAYADTPPAPAAPAAPAPATDQQVWQENSAPTVDQQKATDDKVTDQKVTEEKVTAEKEVKKEEKPAAKKEDKPAKAEDKPAAKSEEKTAKAEDKPAAKSEEKTDEAESSWQDNKKPHGGVHTGGGGLAVSGGGLASGAALLAGGIGVGAYSLRRRRSADGVA
ncbi:hypothetical protein GCM10010193_56900 [Kitasatospora atroaurantiaca]